ncbi:hypothetical protein GCM10022419_095610 [Nonomuraea rosea]|uniref:Uncharacterized protein n=1 Tax=Nonomuraea rosea TaxID=638574 RepID=A0ABP6Z536_9ACTN
MGDVRLHSAEKGLFLGAVEEFDVNGLLPPYQGGEQAVHSVDNAPAGAADEDGGKRAVDFGQPCDVLLILPLQTGRLARHERSDGNGNDLRLTGFGKRGHPGWAGAYGVQNRANSDFVQLQNFHPVTETKLSPRIFRCRMGRIST